MPDLATKFCFRPLLRFGLRSPLYVCADVQVTECMVFEGNKDDFLSKVTSKQRYIQLSADSLDKSGCDVEHIQINSNL